MVDLMSLPEGIEDVTFVQLRTFFCAARSGSFARTAEMLQISQPAVSEQIKALESTLRTPLFVRRKGTTPVLTDAGQRALEAVEQVLGRVSGLFDRPAVQPYQVKLNISAGALIREVYVRPLMARIYREHPDVEIELHPMLMAADALRMIEAGELDMAIHDVPQGAYPMLPGRQPFVLPLALVAPPGTQARLAAGACTLDDFQFVFPVHRDRGSEGWARRCLKDLKLRPRKAPLFIDYMDVIVQLIGSGHNIGYLMAGAAKAELAAGRVEVLDIPLPPMRRYVSCSSRASPVVHEIEHLLCEALGAGNAPIASVAA